MDRFTNGNKETRDRKLHIMIQLGPYVGLSLAGWTVLRILSFLLSLTRKGRESRVGYETTRDRSPFPALRLMNYAQTHHFGGSLQNDLSMPRNYVAVTSSYDTVHMPNILARLLFWRLENGSLKHSIMDFTFLLEGEQEDELPERALSTIRMTHVESDDVALPASISADWGNAYQDDAEPTHAIEHGLQDRLRNLFSDMASIMGSPLRSNTMSRLPPRTTLGLLLESEEVEEEDYNDGLSFVDSDNPMEIAANVITDLLADASIPVRTDQLCFAQSSSSPDQSIGETTGSNYSSVPNVRASNNTTIVRVLSRITREDMKRFWVASNFDPRDSSIRLVETAAWRGVTFPIDKRRCRVELQSGQFFHQGTSKDGNPVFYFRNMCLGPWRGDIDASISAILYRLENGLRVLASGKPDLKILLVVLMGRPCGKPKGRSPQNATSLTNNITEGGGDDQVGQNGSEDGAASNEGSTLDEMTLGAGYEEASSTTVNWVSNPRIDRAETWQVHTNKEMIHRLILILSQHYPERLAQALVVNGKGPNTYFSGSAVAGRLVLGTILDSKETKDKIKFLKKCSDLHRYVDESELVSIVGGRASINPAVFDCR